MSEHSTQTGVLYVVATPIGNLEDITLRALRVLKEVDLVLCEDTRVTRKLLSHYDIKVSTERFDAVVEGKRVETVLDWFREGKRIALVSDAGTPTVSDPGARLVRAVREAGYEVFAVPGPSAVTAALSVAGVPADSFIFFGYPPHKKGRETFFENLKQLLIDGEKTVVFFESTHRIMKTLASLEGVLEEPAHSHELADRGIVVVSELTKMHEEVLTGTAEEIHKTLEDNPQKQKGEFVIIIS